MSKVCGRNRWCYRGGPDVTFRPQIPRGEVSVHSGVGEDGSGRDPSVVPDTGFGKWYPVDCRSVL